MKISRFKKHALTIFIGFTAASLIGCGSSWNYHQATLETSARFPDE